MEFNELYLLSSYLKKWSFGDNRISINYSFTMNGAYKRSHIDMRLGAPANMVNEILNHVFHEAKDLVAQKRNQEESLDDFNYNIILVNESDVKRKLSVFLSKILREFNQNKRSRGRFKMISTRSLDFYYNDFEFEPLTDEIKFFVYLNRGVNKLNGDLWAQAVDDLKQALSFKEKDVMANQYLAQALKKLGKYEASIEHLRVYAQAENTPESLEELAKAYVHIGEFDRAREVYSQIEKEFPDSLLLLFGKAQLAYKEGKGYKTLLDKIYKKDPSWLQEKMLQDWDYKIPAYAGQEDSMWNAASAARYLGFERPFDLTKRAFNEQIPSYFNSEKGTIRFVRAELDEWVAVMNRYKLDVADYKTYEDRLSPQEIAKAKIKKRKTRKSEKTSKAETAESV